MGRERRVPTVRGTARGESQAEITYLRRNTKMIRRAGIRKALAGRYRTNGISTLEQLQEELRQASGIYANIQTLSRDLQEMGAIKVQDAEHPDVQWWVMPAFNPNTEDLRDQMDSELIEQEVANRIAAHVIDIAPVEQFIYILTEARAGPLVGYWMSWLAWPGIVFVQDQMDGCIIHCLNPQAAIQVAERLMGDDRLEGE